VNFSRQQDVGVREHRATAQGRTRTVDDQAGAITTDS
jgi:hypothetical protein